MDLSIIFPAYNEAERIGPTIHSFNQYLLTKKITYEILVVDDGSTDTTVDLVKSLMKNIPQLQIITSLENKGKGHAVRVGMQQATGEIRLFSDADGSTPIEELDRVIQPILTGIADISIGSRYLEQSILEKSQPLYRRIWSRSANGVVQKLLLPGIVDPHCGFKAFSAKTAKNIFPNCTINEWSFDLEVLAKAQSLDLRLVEVPVKWINDERSKGSIKHVPRELYNFYKIKRGLRKRQVI